MEVLPYVHPTAVVDEPSHLGASTKIWHFSHVMEDATIGAGTTLGQNVFVGRGVRIGAGCKIQNNVSLYEGVTLEDDVFCGPSCVFTNVENPRAARSQRGHFVPTRVQRGATIGANATVVCGVTIGAFAFVGAGAVVTRDVPAHALVFGSPARFVGWVDGCGERLEPVTRPDGDDGGGLRCQRCGSEYRVDADGSLRSTRAASAAGSP